MAVRGKHTGKEDLRQRRSKKHLSEALFSLMEERPFREISVVDICDRAMVHRTTFYAHFQDKDDLFRHVLGELLTSAAQTRSENRGKLGLRAGVMEEIRRSLDFFRVHRRFYLSGLSGGVSPELRVIEDTVSKAVEQLAGDLGFEPQMAGIAGRFYAGGIVSLVRWWLENDMPVSEEELIGRISVLIPDPEALDKK